MTRESPTDDGPSGGSVGSDGPGHEHPDMIGLEAAIERVLALRSERPPTGGSESVPIHAIADRRLAEPIRAPESRPTGDRATMDGYAFAAADGYPLSIVGSVFPEDTPPSIGPGEAVRIATGAPLPDRANAVLRREDASVDADGETLRGPPIDPGTYVYQRGSNFGADELLFQAGERLSPRDALLLGDIGLASVRVHARPTVGLLATGTEIHEGRQPDLDSPMLASLLESWGGTVETVESVPDRYDAVEGRIAVQAAEHDVVVTTGGTSVGDKDHVVRALDALGTVRFHRVRLRPGKPIAVATLDDHGAVAFAIPGKPIGAHLVTALVVRPYFCGNGTGARTGTETGSRTGTGIGPAPAIPATMTVDLDVGPNEFTYGIPVTLADGNATPLGHVTSPLTVFEDRFDPSVLSASTRASRADGVVLINEAIQAGETVAVIPFSVLNR